MQLPAFESNTLPALTPEATLAAFSTNPHLRTLRFGHTTGAELAPADPVFQLIGTGLAHERALVATTPGARALQANTDWPGLERSIRTALSLDDARRGFELNRIGLATTLDESLFNTMVAGIADDPSFTSDVMSAMNGDTNALAELQSTFDTWSSKLEGITAFDFGANVYHQRMDLRYATVQAMRTAAHGEHVDTQNTSYASDVIAHELEHTITPAPDIDDPNASMQWLEEGSAQLFTENGGGERMAAALNLPYERSLGMHGDNWRWQYCVEQVLAMAGVDAATPDGYARALAMLQEPDFAAVPAAIAAAIGRARHLPPNATTEVAQRISKLDAGDVEGNHEFRQGPLLRNIHALRTYVDTHSPG